MSDHDVLQVLDRLALLLRTPVERPNAQAIADWHDEFKRSVATAERGPGWAEIKDRAKVLGVLLNRRMALIQGAQRTLRQKLDRNVTGRRALTAYQTTPR